MEYILSASQISDKECGDMGPISKYSLSDMGPTVDYRIFPGIFSSENQKNFSGLKTHRDKVIDNIVF